MAFIRTFLAGQNRAAPPWASSESTIDGLVSLPVEERDNDRFRLQARMHPDRIKGSDVLGHHTTDVFR